ncbi:uncharacterized protein LOC126667913 isoform X2 [Mercurialis annua]|uniref:uncharacterized protein LOC126667913 isoform X2 n=1 Tax=Mercurialis annua TaxID=3986 RepID=UPI00215F1392|nr:uncharacterized protein LOC126667913 isoform X2 [Mercurialis annua]
MATIPHFDPKQKKPSMFEAVGRGFVIRFLRSFISTGCLNLLEAGGSTLTFQGADKKCYLKVDLLICNPQFYWKIMTRADVGIADAYIDGDFIFFDKDEGLLQFIMLLIANQHANKSVLNSNKNGSWWTPLFLTAGFATIKMLYQHASRKNSLTQARRNISQHYNVSNDFFAMFLGKTMTYSTAIFKTEEEDLSTAQMRKISVLIEKSRIQEKHQVLDIGCGWGTFGIEAVKRTGCKYTGITLSEEQLKFAETKVKEAGLQDLITLKLCDYRQLPESDKFDRIISCEMIEHVGHEYMDEFFRCCESLLAVNGLLILQFISIPDEKYEECRRNADFMKEYIFPGGCLPSFSRVISAMNTASTLNVEHVENIGSHYGRTLRFWRQNFLDNQRKILKMGFDEKFIRTWEYYFDYCAAGFKTYTLGDYQMVFSRSGNMEALGDPYKGFPSAQ